MRYEIRVIDAEEMKRVGIYFVDKFEVKTDDYGYMVDDKMVGKKVGFKLDGKNRKTWLHTVRTMIQIVDKETEDVTVYKSQEEILREIGKEYLIG